MAKTGVPIRLPLFDHYDRNVTTTADQHFYIDYIIPELVPSIFEYSKPNPPSIIPDRLK